MKHSALFFMIASVYLSLAGCETIAGLKTAGGAISDDTQSACICQQMSNVEALSLEKMAPEKTAQVVVENEVAALPRPPVISVMSASVPARQRFEPYEALESINKMRKHYNLPPVVLNQLLMKITDQHTQDLARHNRVSHKGSDGADLAIRLKRAGYDPLIAEENLSGGQRSFEEALAAWMKSPDHRKRLLNPNVTELGIALTYDTTTDYRTFWALILADPF